MEEAQPAAVTTLADRYVASAFREGVWVGRQQAITTLLEVGSEGFKGLELIEEFSRRLTDMPMPPFRHG